MATPSKATVDANAALAVRAPTVGGCVTAVTTTTAYLDVSSLKGYISLCSENQDLYFAFVSSASVTLVTLTAAVGTVAVAQYLPKNTPTHYVLPENRRTLAYRTVSGSDGILRVHPS